MTVPAGKFWGCLRMRREDLEPDNVVVTSEYWFHPIVPVVGVVRRRSRESAAMVALIAFGASGARSEF